MKREIILDLYIFSQDGRFLAVDRKFDDYYLSDTLTMPILTLPVGYHPIEYVKTYLNDKGLIIKDISLLPAIYLNRFDSELDVDYLVLSVKVNLKDKSDLTLIGDKENKNFLWLSIDDFLANSRLMPEFKQNGLDKIFEGESLFYKGTYKDSDGSNTVLSWESV